MKRFLQLVSHGILALGMAVILNGCSTTEISKASTPRVSSARNDAELLIYRCGKPDKDDSTENDRPRPPIPTRLITYKKAHLMFAYYPGGEATIDDPPPYQWKLLGIKDTHTNAALKPEDMKPTLSGRLPCALGN